MSPQEMNIAIAESMGWQTGHCEASGTWIVLNPDGDELAYTANKTEADLSFASKIPSYTTDLNAIMPLIAELPDLSAFTIELVKVVNWSFDDVCMSMITKIQHTATAAQRAEAYCEVKGLLKGSTITPEILAYRDEFLDINPKGATS